MSQTTCYPQVHPPPQKKKKITKFTFPARPSPHHVEVCTHLYAIQAHKDRPHLNTYIHTQYLFTNNTPIQGYVYFSIQLQFKPIFTYFPLPMDGSARDFKFLVSARTRQFLTHRSSFSKASVSPVVGPLTWMTQRAGSLKPLQTATGNEQESINMTSVIYITMMRT